MTPREKTRCTWAPAGKPLYLAYHDQQWGVPVHDDRTLFEMLILEGAQAGLAARIADLEHAGLAAGRPAVAASRQ